MTLATGNRPSWDEYAMMFAQVAATRAACSRRQVGAAIMDDKHAIVSTGYNGVPAGMLNCSDGGCPRGRLTYEECPAYGGYDNCTGWHAERNAIMYAEMRGVDLTKCTLSVTHDPCDDCAALIAEKGILRVISPNSRGRAIFNDNRKWWNRILFPGPLGLNRNAG